MYARFFLARVAVALGTLGLSLVASALDAGLVQVTVDPNPFSVYCGTKKAGEIKIENYYKNENFLRNGVPWSGAVMEALFNEDPNFCLPGEDIANLRWIQAVTAGTNTIGTPPYLDPFNRDDGLPFYWTEAENADPADGKNGTRFFDAPAQAVSNPNNDITFEAALFCVDLSTMQMSFLGGFEWGYSRSDTDGDGQRDDITLKAFKWLNAITNSMKTLIENWDASNTSPYTGDGTPDGWKVVDECQCKCTPEPGSLCMVLGAGGCYGLVLLRRWRGRKAAPTEAAC